MTEIGFAVKEVIPQGVCKLEVLAAEKAEAYGLQIGLKLKVVGGEHDQQSPNSTERLSWDSAPCSWETVSSG